MAKTTDAFGYVLMENDNSIREVSNLEIFDQNHLFYIRFNTILQSLDCINRNNRQYKGEAIEASLSTPEIAELIRNNKFKGEAGHPVGEGLQRVATVDPKLTCHRIIKWWRDKDLIRGTVETLDDGLYGTKLTKAILQNENPSFSYRGLARLEKKGSTTFVNSPPRCIAYDEVNLPSHKEAYADREKTTVGLSYSGNMLAKPMSTVLQESVNLSDASRIITGTEIAEFVCSKSENVQMVCESFDIDPASIHKIMGNRVSIKSGGDTYVFALEQKLARDVANMWARV